MNEILRTEKLNKFFYEPEPFQVLTDISFAVNEGEFVALIGKSGSGKSTLLYLLSTLDTDYEGRLIIKNNLLTGLSQDALAKFRNDNIGFVFQFHFLLPEFTALENVMMPALKQGKYKRSDIEEMAMEKLRQMEMQEYAKKPSAKLSGGQQQRVAIARALINEPAIVMADEPTGNLDSTNSEIVIEIFEDICRNKGKTIIMVTHDNDFAQRASRILELVDGRLKK
ncbi:MAG TPA: ABC transporter ATP-binding protein [Puia sp.]|nr:ABC transporter ATP-binding protein [Puia sp.]